MAQRLEALAFEMGAMWALKTLGHALSEAEARTVGVAKIDAMLLSDCMAPPMVLIAQVVKAEAEAMFPDYPPTEAEMRGGKHIPVHMRPDND